MSERAPFDTLGSLDLQTLLNRIKSLNSEIDTLKQKQQLSQITQLEALNKREKQFEKMKSSEQEALDRNKELTIQLRSSESELKSLKALEPERLKKNLAENKKKNSQLKKDNKAQNLELISVRKELRKVKKAHENDLKELHDSQSECDGFFYSEDRRWQLSITSIRLINDPENSDIIRVRCHNMVTGSSALALGIKDSEAIWSHPMIVPKEIEQKAVKEILRMELTVNKDIVSKEDVEKILKSS